MTYGETFAVKSLDLYLGSGVVGGLADHMPELMTEIPDSPPLIDLASIDKVPIILLPSDTDATCSHEAVGKMRDTSPSVIAYKEVLPGGDHEGFAYIGTPEWVAEVEA